MKIQFNTLKGLRCHSLGLLLTMSGGVVAAPLATTDATLAVEVQQQETKVEIKGVVVDKTGEPLPGVTVWLVGTTFRASTGIDGDFVLPCPREMKKWELQFTFVGMQTKTLTVTAPEKSLKIVLEESSQALDEVVITGMEVIKREHMVGSANVVNAKDLRMQGISSVDRILDGMVAGLNSTTISGAPGSRAKITIRGENNLSGRSEPLWIIDGLPMMSGVPVNNTGDYAGSIMQDGVGNVMPEDIESISILKDASATAIYGARAANGVIVITTKKGFRSKTQVSYNGTYELSTAPSHRIKFMNSAEKLDYERSIVDVFGMDYASMAGRGGFLYQRHTQGFLTPVEYAQHLERLKATNTDWFDVLFRTAQSQLHSVSLRGGSEELTYYTSFNLQSKSGILRSNQYQNAGALMKMDYRPVKNLILALNLSANARRNRDHASVVDPFNYAMFANPYERPYDENGNYDYDLSYLANNRTNERASGYKFDRFNILNELDQTRKKQDGLDFDMTFNLRYTILPGLSVESIYRRGVSYNTSTTEVEAGTYASWVGETLSSRAYKDMLLPDKYNDGSLTEASGKNHNWSWRNQIDYSFALKKDHLFSILLANEVMSKKYTNFGYTSPYYSGDYRITGLPMFDKDVAYEDLRAQLAALYNTKDGQDRSLSYLASLRYGYKDRYIVNFNFRADGADAIGDAKRYTPLWSVGGRYNLHREKFFANPIVSELSLRASFGYTGNIDRTAYPFYTISFGSDAFMGNRLVSKFTYPNPTITWEKKRDLNLGLEVSFLKNRINMTLEYYKSRTENILEDLQIPISLGRTSVKANGGIVENQGVELFTNVRWISTKDLTFSTSFNLARNKNVIVRSNHTYGSWREATRSNASQGGVINVVGEETGSIYGWRFAGVNPATGNPQVYLTESGKHSLRAMLDSWNSLSDERRRELLEAMGGDVNGDPVKMDYHRGANEQGSYIGSSMTYLGRSNPLITGGFNTSLRYKDFEFSTSWTFKTGHIVPNFNDFQNAPVNGESAERVSLGYSSDLSVSSTNRERKYLYYWQHPGDVTSVPRFTTASNDLWASMVTDVKYSKGDYLRLNNLSLSYRFRQPFVKEWGLSTLSLAFVARNLLTLTKYPGLDVATGSAFAYPVSRDFSLKLSVGF
ncbi:MAG: SusC/RagA family TonB-linked outer membrane protein [Bacteroides sp.]|nr:SusC/RagA family TonB-linked outer membrane protein [Bacteroides sp.]